MISIIITSFKEAGTIGRAIESFLKQKIKEKYELIVSAPDKETINEAKKYKKVKVFKDPGKGKSYALNLILPKIKGEIIILTDGDVFASENSVNQILEKFKDNKVGAVSGRPVSINPRNNLFGFWSKILVESAHMLRERRAGESKFLECSGYLWAFRNKIIKNFPTDVAEDSIVPIFLWKKGYKIDYATKAEVYVKYPDNLKDLIEQKRRAMQSHEKLEHYSGKFPKMKSFFNELIYSYRTFLFPESIKEFFWLLLLFPIRLYTWILAIYQRKAGKKYSDSWKRVESTK